MKCKKCGSEFVTMSNSCPECGAALGWRFLPEKRGYLWYRNIAFLSIFILGSIIYTIYYTKNSGRSLDTPYVDRRPDRKEVTRDASVRFTEDTYFVNQDCYFGVSYDALVKATKLAASGDYKGVRQMEAQGLIFMPDQGWEVVIKSYKNNGKVVCVSPVNESGSFWGFKAFITKWVLK